MAWARSWCLGATSGAAAHPATPSDLGGPKQGTPFTETGLCIGTCLRPGAPSALLTTGLDRFPGASWALWGVGQYPCPPDARSTPNRDGRRCPHTLPSVAWRGRSRPERELSESRCWLHRLFIFNVTQQLALGSGLWARSFQGFPAALEAGRASPQTPRMLSGLQYLGCQPATQSLEQEAAANDPGPGSSSRACVPGAGHQVWPGTLPQEVWFWGPCPGREIGSGDRGLWGGASASTCPSTSVALRCPASRPWAQR